jgi:hypothetical protein
MAIQARTAPDGPDETTLLARLGDLLQLECDALPAYSLAIMALRDGRRRDDLRGWRADHERHVRDLSDLIRVRGGVPIPIPHLPTGVFKLGVQAIGAASGGDRAVLLAFKSNELQSREKYARLAALDNPPDVAAMLSRAAEDEARHYAWAVGELEALGAGGGTAIGAATDAFASFHGAVADAVEGVGRLGMEALMRGLRPSAR